MLLLPIRMKYIFFFILVITWHCSGGIQKSNKTVIYPQWSILDLIPQESSFCWIILIRNIPEKDYSNFLDILEKNLNSLLKLKFKIKVKRDINAILFTDLKRDYINSNDILAIKFNYKRDIIKKVITDNFGNIPRWKRVKNNAELTILDKLGILLTSQDQVILFNIKNGKESHASFISYFINNLPYKNSPTREKLLYLLKKDVINGEPAIAYIGKFYITQLNTNIDLSSRVWFKEEIYLESKILCQTEEQCLAINSFFEIIKRITENITPLDPEIKEFLFKDTPIIKEFVNGIKKISIFSKSNRELGLKLSLDKGILSQIEKIFSVFLPPGEYYYLNKIFSSSS